jgi:hypothetical protein
MKDVLKLKKCQGCKAKFAPLPFKKPVKLKKVIKNSDLLMKFVPIKSK